MNRNLVGTLIKGRYHIEHRLGKGGFAEVYLATDTRFGARKVAIKVLLSEVVLAPVRIRSESPMLGADA